MYIIDSSIDMPDIAYMEKRIKEEMKEGVAVNDLSLLRSRFATNSANALSIMQSKYGIVNPNSSKQVIDYYLTEMQKEIREITVKYPGLSFMSARTLCDIAADMKDRYIKEVTVEKCLEYADFQDFTPSLLENVAKVLQEIMELELFKAMRREGKWTTSGDAMKPLALLGREDSADLLTYRKNKKYSETIETFMSAKCADGRIHPTVSLGITNRINYSGPALMNIPKDLLWNVIGPRTPGNMLVSIDIKNQEPWIMINMLGIEKLKAMLDNKGKLYETVFEDIFGTQPTPIERKEFKTLWNALTYGMSIKGAEMSCTHIDGKKVYKYFNSFPEYKAYKSRCNALAKKQVQLSKTYFDTEVYANTYGPKLSRVLMDIGIQGTGADILSLLIKHFDIEVEHRGLQDVFTFYFSRHDETIIEVDKDYVEEVGKDNVIETLRDIFEHRIDDWEPFQVEIKEVGNSEIEIDNYYDEE